MKGRDWLIQFALVILDHDVIFADCQDMKTLIVALDTCDGFDLRLATLLYNLAVVQVPQSDFSILVSSYQERVCSGVV